MKTGKDWIENVSDTLKQMQDNIERDNDRIETLKANLISTTAIQYDSDKVMSSCEGDKLAIYYATYFDLDKRLVQEYEKMAIFKAQSIQQLNKYVQNPTLAYCLERRHIQLKGNRDICMEDNITDRALRKRFEKAYNLLNSIYVLEKYRRFS